MTQRPPCVAGMFYPDNPTALRASVEAWLATAQGPLVDALVTLLPHAGHVYCGHIIGKTLGRVRLPQSVLLLCPNHSGQGHALGVWTEGQWHTPLGATEVDSELATALLDLKCGFAADRASHLKEHSLEVLLPFLQCHSPHTKIVPVSIAMQDMQALQAIGTAVGNLLSKRRAQGQECSIIVSSDMNHFDDQQTTVRKDSLALAALLQLDPELLLQQIIANKISMCGILPAICSIYAAQAQKNCVAEIVQYTTSAETSNDMSRVVGYCGLLVK